jgi:hypothetical protein
MKVSIFKLLRHNASVPTNFFFLQMSALAYGARNGFPKYDT